jgi:hypothetical protein
MKKSLLVPVVAAFLACPAIGHADPKAPPDVVLLENGGMVRGTVSEKVPGDYVVIQLVDGDTRKFSMDEVSYAGPEEGAPKRVKKAPADQASAEKAAATVEVRTDAEGVTVAEITDRMTASAGNVVAVAEAWKDLCTAPCKLELAPGMHELMIYGDGFPSATKKVDVRKGDRALVAKPGSSGLTFLGGTFLTLGSVAAILGGTFLFVNKESTEYNSDGSESTKESATHKLALPLVLGGLVGVGGGIGLSIAGRTTLEDTAPADRGAKARAPASAWGVSYGGAF